MGTFASTVASRISFSRLGLPVPQIFRLDL